MARVLQPAHRPVLYLNRDHVTPDRAPAARRMTQNGGSASRHSDRIRRRLSRPPSQKSDRDRERDRERDLAHASERHGRPAVTVTVTVTMTRIPLPRPVMPSEDQPFKARPKIGRRRPSAAGGGRRQANTTRRARAGADSDCRAHWPSIPLIPARPAGPEPARSWPSP